MTTAGGGRLATSIGGTLTGRGARRHRRISTVAPTLVPMEG